MARERLNGNWLNPVLTGLVYVVLVGVVGAIPILGPVASLLVGGPLLLGLIGYFIKFARRQECDIENLFDGFRLFVPAMVLYLLVVVFTILWSLLLIIPGIIAALGYSMTFFIMNDNPQIQAMDAINLSKEMMRGQKGKLFLLYLSFIGWGILCVLTLGIGFLWLSPYMYTSMAYFYEDLRNASLPSIGAPADAPPII